MKVCVFPSDLTGCGKYRLIWPAEALKAQGHDVEIQRRPKIMVSRTGQPPKVVGVLIDNFDVVVFQRPGTYQISQLIPFLHEKGTKVVIDMDDDLSTIHPWNPAYRHYHPDHSPYRNWKWAMKACNMADLVTCTTAALADKYAPHGRFSILPNCVPSRYLEISRTENEKVTVGYAGWTRTHPEDLQITSGAINEAVTGTGARFMAVGDSAIFEKLGVRNRAPNVYAGPANFDVYPNVISQFDIGIVPLAKSEFNKAKSWLKALEYAALGVAPIVSPTPDNMMMVREGAALVAENPKDWLEITKKLITNEIERKELQKRAWDFAQQWTIEDRASLWWHAWCTL